LCPPESSWLGCHSAEVRYGVAWAKEKGTIHDEANGVDFVATLLVAETTLAQETPLVAESIFQ